ncbi:MAG: TetR/AcrR family transcriptional regulator [Ancrocorticia sp.]
MTGQTTTPKKRAPRGKYAKTDETRKAILDEALHVFAASGYRAGSVAKIATNIGMTEAGIAYHFPNKAALLQAVLDYRDDQLREIIISEGDGIRMLKAVIELHESLTQSRGYAELYCVVSAEAINPKHPAHERFVNQRRGSRKILRDAFQDLAAKNLLAPGVDPNLAGDICSAHIDGIQIQWLLEAEEINMAEQVECLFRQFIPSWPTEGHS